MRALGDQRITPAEARALLVDLGTIRGSESEIHLDEVHKRRVDRLFAESDQHGAGSLGFGEFAHYYRAVAALLGAAPDAAARARPDSAHGRICPPATAAELEQARLEEAKAGSVVVFDGSVEEAAVLRIQSRFRGAKARAEHPEVGIGLAQSRDVARVKEESATKIQARVRGNRDREALRRRRAAERQLLQEYADEGEGV